MNKLKKPLKGETLIEVLIAVSVIIIIMLPAAALKIQAARNSAYNRDYLVADSLATSGLEIMRDIRDTNFLRFTVKKNLCWNTKIEYKGAVDECDKSTNLIKNGSFILKENMGGTGMELVWQSDSKLSDDFNPADDSAYRLYQNPSTKLYVHDAAFAPTNFYREIYIEYSKSGKTMFVASRVFFKNGGKVKNVLRITALTPQSKK